MALNTEAVWTTLHAGIRGFVARRVRQQADVDDIVQRVFLQVHRALPTLRETDKLHAWVYQTTRRAIADFYRAPSQNREVTTGTVEDVANELPVMDSREDEETANRELSTCLRPLMSGLSAADQEALQMVEFDGVTQVDAAARLGLSVSGMKSRVQRARVHLRTALDECCRIALDRRGGVISYEARTDQCDSCHGPSDVPSCESSRSSTAPNRPR